MQRNDLAEKKRVLIDGEEIPGLVRFAEIPLEKGQLEVPEFDKIRRIQNGITTVPPIEMTYKITRDSNTLAFFKEWFLQNLEKDVTVIRVDAAGQEFARTLMPNCECVQYTEPEFDASNPTFAQVRVTLAPWDIVPIDSES